MTISIDKPEGIATTLLEKYVWDKPSGEQGLRQPEKINPSVIVYTKVNEK